MKILHVIFSCNRLEYLTRSLESHTNIDYGDHDVTKIIIDDYPQTRNDAIFDLISKTHNVNLWLNNENNGLSLTWTNFFSWLKLQDYDYVLHQEDDVVLLSPIKLDDLIHILNSDEKIASVVLQRQPWYFDEKECKVENDDVEILDYHYSKNTKTFPIIFSLYRKSLSEYPFKDYWNFNLNEGMIMVYLQHHHHMFSATLKGKNGENLIDHIGEICTGKRVLEGEPNWENFSHMDPNKFYTSREGKLVED
jgi:hypothetical protein